MKKAEPKHKNYSFGITQLYHNVFASFQLNNGSALPAQGDGDDQRIGDQINVSGMWVRGILGQKADRPNVTFKYYVMSVPKGSAYNYNNWFENVISNLLLDSPNKDFVKVLTSGTMKPHDGSMDNATDEYVYPWKIWIPYRKLVKFGPGNGVTTQNDNDIYLLLGCFDAYGTLITDNIAYSQLALTTYYKDP